MKELMEALKKMKKNKSSKDKTVDHKLEVLQHLKEMAHQMMGEDLKGLKKVTVAAKDDNGLREGLEKAEELLGGKPEDDEDEMDEE